MEKRFTIFNFFSEAIIIFSIMVICIAFSAKFFGSDAGEISTLYQFGRDGIAVDTIFQFLLASLAMEISKVLWFSGRIFKNMMTFWRTVGMTLSVIPIIALFASVFSWFPLDNVNAWCGFLITYGIFFGLSLLAITLKIKLENKKIDEGFKKYRKEHGLEDGDEQY